MISKHKFIPEMQMPRYLCVAAFFAFLQLCVPQQFVVTTKSGKVGGKISKDRKGNSFYSFQSIPYAKPPLGNLRFKAAEPVEHWQHVLNGTRPPPKCPQKNKQNEVIGQEDCLVLNIYTPHLPTSNKTLLPVMVHIHGGAFREGYTGQYCGPELILADRGVVLVTINYRLGFLGFAHLQNKISGNAGMKDQVLALKWVKDNIEYFNGNSNKVTIFGISAGSASVHLHLVSPMSSGLFHGAIAQSGCALNTWVDGVNNNAKYLGEMLNISSNNDQIFVESLRRVSIKDLIIAQEKLLNDFGVRTPWKSGIVVEDGINETPFLSQKPINILQNGTFNHVPSIIGYASQEGVMNLNIPLSQPSEAAAIVDFENNLPYVLNNKTNVKIIANKVREFYYPNDTVNSSVIFQPTINYITDTWFLYHIYIAVQKQLQSSKEPIYFYRFSADTKLNYWKKKVREVINYPGAAHSDDGCYLLAGETNTNITKGSIEDISIDRMVKLWTNFAKFGNPTPINESSIGIIWKPVTMENFEALEIGNELALVKNPDMNRINFWKEIYKM